MYKNTIVCEYVYALKDGRLPRPNTESKNETAPMERGWASTDVAYERIRVCEWQHGKGWCVCLRRIRVDLTPDTIYL